MLDAKQLTANVRTWNPNGKVTIATNAQPYAVSEYGTFFHRVTGVALYWPDGHNITNATAEYKCGGFSSHPVFYKRIPRPTRRRPNVDLCKKCFKEA